MKIRDCDTKLEIINLFLDKSNALRVKLNKIEALRKKEPFLTRYLNVKNRAEIIELAQEISSGLVQIGLVLHKEFICALCDESIPLSKMCTYKNENYCPGCRRSQDWVYDDWECDDWECDED